MLRQVKIFLLLLASTAFFSQAVLSQPQPKEEDGIPKRKEYKWVKIIQSSGITVHRREDPNSNMFEFKGQGIIKAPVPKLIALLQDVKLMPKWVEGCKRAKELYKNFDENSYHMRIRDYTMIIYAQNKVPWPLSDRDYVLKGRISYNAKRDAAYINLLNTKHKKMPPKKGIVRMNFMRTRVILDPRKDDKWTWMQLYVHLDPGGFIPAWVVNFVTKSVPLKSIKKLRRLAASNNYNKGIEKLVNYHVEKLRRPKASADSSKLEKKKKKKKEKEKEEAQKEKEEEKEEKEKVI